MKKAIIIVCLAAVLLVSTGGLSHSLDLNAIVAREADFTWQVDGLSQDPPLTKGLPKALSVDGNVYIPMQLLAAVQGYNVDLDLAHGLVSLTKRELPQATPQVIIQEVVVESKGTPSPPPVSSEPPISVPAPAEPTEETSNWEERAAAILATGDALVGTPHLYGSPQGQTETFDCSSFVQHVFQQHGITLFRSSEYQAMQGVEIAKEDLRKGDLVFFSSTRSGPDKIGHVAIYAGEGRLLHTFNERGVTYSPLSGAYWTSHYITARRVFLK